MQGLVHVFEVLQVSMLVVAVMLNCASLVHIFKELQVSTLTWGHSQDLQCRYWLL